jgi:hypothetical protein
MSIGGYLYWANSKDAIIAALQIGEFNNGVGEFCATDTLDDRAILVWVRARSTAPGPSAGTRCVAGGCAVSYCRAAC